MSSPSKSKALSKKGEQDLRHDWLKMVYEDVNHQQQVTNESNGALSQNGIISETIKRFRGSLRWLNRNNLNYFILQQQALTTAGTSTAPVIMVHDSEDCNDEESDRTGISEITWDTESKSTDKAAVTSKILDLKETEKAKATLNENTTRDVTENATLLSDFDLTSFETDGSTMDFDALSSSEQPVSSSWSEVGRPKGNTSLVKNGKHHEIVDAKNFCAVVFLKLKKSKENGQTMVRSGLYDRIIKHASEKFDVPIGCLKKTTFKTRVKEGRKKMCAHRGPLSPMYGVEAHLLKCLLLHHFSHQENVELHVSQT
jgi:hypothetical protein